MAKRVVILGGGFAGVYTAIRLERLRSRRDDVQVSPVEEEREVVAEISRRCG